MVINGIKAGRTDFPWLVAQFHHREKFMCGGSLVSHQIVVTAAHCIHQKGTSDELNPNLVTYYIGKYDITSLNEDGYVSSDVQRFVVHNDWDASSDSYDSDIAIAILTKKIQFSNTIRPICIWSKSQGHSDIVDVKGLIAGKI